MRALAFILLSIAARGEAQIVPSTPSPIPFPQPTVWNPAAAYITIGQDEPGYRLWYGGTPSHPAEVKAFNQYLVAGQVGGIVPTWQLLRTATSWKDCAAQPFEVPPTDEWPHIVQTLRFVHDYVVPAVGPVEPVSVYRNPSLNVCAGGALESAHKQYSAIDMVPLQPIVREDLERRLCAIHGAHGEQYAAGLGFYAFLRFHIDTIKYRRWGTDLAVAADCPPIIHPEDVNSVYQPPVAAPSVTVAPFPPPLVSPGPVPPAPVPPVTVPQPVPIDPLAPRPTPPNR